ncbi:MAG: superoxide dismutase [Ni] [Planctomycetota bacterium]|jgi:nickel superoxide dismutase
MKQFKKVQTQLIMLLVIMGIGATTQVYSHCQLPCGIYDDATRLKLIGEHILTIEKSMKQILTFSRQLVRWVQNKEQHADALSEIVTGYFMAQRVKPVAVDSPQYKKYIEQLTLLHQMLQTSMKCKQTTELLHIEELKTLLDDFSKAYQG